LPLKQLTRGSLSLEPSWNLRGYNFFINRIFKFLQTSFLKDPKYKCTKFQVILVKLILPLWPAIRYLRPPNDCKKFAIFSSLSQKCHPFYLQCQTFWVGHAIYTNHGLAVGTKKESCFFIWDKKWQKTRQFISLILSFLYTSKQVAFFHSFKIFGMRVKKS
jgi:hypothetical protein